MPAWNVSKYIEESINSIISQTFKDWILVVIDDGSTDNTFEVLKNILDERCMFFKNDSHEKLIGKLKNKAISLLPETEFICHVGSDDIISNDCFSSYVEFMDKNQNISAACGNFECFDNLGRNWKLPHVFSDKIFNREKLLKYMNFYPTRFYRRSAVLEVGGYSNTLSSAVDYDLALKLDEKFTLGRLDKITYFYRQHSNQVSTFARKEQDSNAKKALQDALNRRGLNQDVINDTPPFFIKERSEHFIFTKR